MKTVILSFPSSPRLLKRCPASNGQSRIKIATTRTRRFTRRDRQLNTTCSLIDFTVPRLKSMLRSGRSNIDRLGRKTKLSTNTVKRCESSSPSTPAVFATPLNQIANRPIRTRHFGQWPMYELIIANVWSKNILIAKRFLNSPECLFYNERKFFYTLFLKIKENNCKLITFLYI